MIRVLLISTLVILSIKTSQIDNLNLLLPQLQENILFQPVQLITAQGGCYIWSSSMKEILQIKPFEDKQGKCSKQAIVSVIQPGSFTSSISISAQDTATMTTLTIPVRIRKLARISIVTKSRMMNIKQIQKIQLFAYDQDSNTFTSLQGLRFKWTLEQNNKIIQQVSLHHAKLYLPLRTRQNLQKKGFQSDLLVVKALAPGNIKVKVSCIQKGYEKLFDQITISVHERFSLVPGPIIRVSPSTNLQLSLIRPNQDMINLPLNYYKITSCTNFIINDTLYLKTSSLIEKCLIKVQDMRTKPPYQSTVQVIIEEPDSIKIVADQTIVVGQNAPYQVKLFKNGKLLVGDSNLVRVQSDFDILTSNHSFLSKTKKIGRIFAYYKNLKAEAIVSAILPIKILLPNDYLHLPVGQTFKLKVVGGSGTYDYDIKSQLATINNLAMIHAKVVGQTVIVVNDRNNNKNQAIVKLKISDLATISSLQNHKQLNRDEWGYLYIIAKNNKQQMFTQCTNNKFILNVPSTKLQIDKKTNFQDNINFLKYHNSTFVQKALQKNSLFKNKKVQFINLYSQYVINNDISSLQLQNYFQNLQNYGICQIVKFKSLVSLQDKMTIYLHDHQYINTKIQFRTYDSLSTNIQEDNVNFLMTPQSTLQWKYFGGSYNWYDSKTIIKINGEKKQQKYPIISCPSFQKALHSYDMNIKNQQNQNLLFPTSQQTKINIACKFPKKLNLKLEKGDVFDQISIHKNSVIKGYVLALDQFQKVFYNSSNLKYQYSAINGKYKNKNQQFQYQSVGKDDQFNVFTQNLISGKKFTKVNQNLKISVVQPLQINHESFPQNIDKGNNFTILNVLTPNKPFIINLKNKSPLLNVQCSGVISCEKGEQNIAIKHLNSGNGEVIIKDKRVYGSKQWKLNFIIVDPQQLKITGSRNYIQQGQTIEAILNLYYNNKLIHPSTYQSSYLSINIDKGLKIINQDGNKFTIKAEKANQYLLSGQNTYPKQLKSKNSFRLTVYQKIHPNIDDVQVHQQKQIVYIKSKIAFIRGCKRIITISGGPYDMILKHIQSSEITVQNNNKLFKISSVKQGEYNLNITATYQGNIIAVIYIDIIVSKIKSVQLFSLDEPIINSQFRINPKIYVNQYNLQSCTCNFDFVWSTDNNRLKLGQSTSLGFLEAGGVNATAISPGFEVVSLEIIDKDTSTVLSKTFKKVNILKQIQFNMPHIIYDNKRLPSSIIVPPSSNVKFNNDVSFISQDGLIHVGFQNNILQTSKKLGHTTITMSQKGYQSINIEVQVKQISGIFIENNQGIISLEPGTNLKARLFLQDNHGKLFYTPLTYPQIIIKSQNQQIVNSHITQNTNQIVFNGINQGSCVVCISLVNMGVFDCVAVNVGTLILPSRNVNVLKGGYVMFSIKNQQGSKWSSLNKGVATIDQITGKMNALQYGSTKISYDSLYSTVNIVKVHTIQKQKQPIYTENTMHSYFKATWIVAGKVQQISNFNQFNFINNKFNPTCATKNKDLQISTSIVRIQEKDIIECSLKLKNKKQWPANIQLSIQSNKQQISKFNFVPQVQFTYQPQHLYLSSKNPSGKIQIKTNKLIKISHLEGDSSWISSRFDQNNKIQIVNVNMNRYQGQMNWNLTLRGENQVNSIKITYSKKEENKNSFWSFNLDWPDYLVIFMGIIFLIISLNQYFSQQKLKRN